jgi:hypothetical protein
LATFQTFSRGATNVFSGCQLRILKKGFHMIEQQHPEVEFEAGVYARFSEELHKYVEQALFYEGEQLRSGEISFQEFAQAVSCHAVMGKEDEPKPSRRPRSPSPGLPLSARLLGRPRRLRHPQADWVGHNARTTITPHPRPAAHHERSGGGNKASVFFWVV